MSCVDTCFDSVHAPSISGQMRCKDSHTGHSLSRASDNKAFDSLHAPSLPAGLAHMDSDTMCLIMLPACDMLTMVFEFLVSSFCSGLMELKGVDMPCWGNSSGQ